jgi:hypothetical protein
MSAAWWLGNLAAYSVQVALVVAVGGLTAAALRIAPLPSALRDAQALVGVAPAFYFSDRVGTPVTLGGLDPAIILPRWFERMDESHQRTIACHELLHVARRDWLLNLLEELVLAFFWFHPAVRWAVRSIRLSREQVVDSDVVALSGARQPYLRASRNRGDAASDDPARALVPGRKPTGAACCPAGEGGVYVEAETYCVVGDCPGRRCGDWLVGRQDFLA